MSTHSTQDPEGAATSHAPGPWRWEPQPLAGDDELVRQRLVDAGGRLVLAAEPEQGLGEGGHWTRMSWHTGDRDLVAAAPELRGALVAAVDELAACAEFFQAVPGSRLGIALEAARRVLARLEDKR